DTDKQIKTKKTDYPHQFEAFWWNYPRKIEKAGAFRAWKARLKEGFDDNVMSQAATNYSAFCEAAGTEERYIKHAATFLGPDKPFEEYCEGLRKDWTAKGQQGASGSNGKPTFEMKTWQPPSESKVPA
ncbi:MAG: hypothetical protein WC637_20900, partial [Victivallales bacterium]